MYVLISDELINIYQDLMNEFWFTWEVELITFLQSKLTPAIKTFSEAITFFGDEYAMIIVIGFLYWGYKKDLGKKIALYAISALLATISLNNLVKRSRPYIDHKSIKCVKPRTSEGDPNDLLVQGYSFPSGHATDSISTFGALCLNIKNNLLKILFVLLIVLIGLSRIILGVHYPTDVLAGWFVSAFMIFVISKIKNENIVYMMIISIGVLGLFVCRSTDYFSSLGIAIGFICGFIYEEKYVNFKNTNNIFIMILRTIGGLALFVVLDKILKIPFSEALLASKTVSAFLIRIVRYIICCFVLIGIYPKCFVYFEKLLNKKSSH